MRLRCWALFIPTIWSSMFFARADFLRRRWLLGPFVRSSLPEPVTLKRLAVALCVLILYFLPTVCLPCSDKSYVHSHQKVGRLRHPTTTRPSFWSIADCWACQGGEESLLGFLRRGKDHQHGPALHRRTLFDKSDVVQLTDNPVHLLARDLGVRNLTAPEPDSHLDLVAILQPAASVADLEREVVIGGLRPEADLLDLDLLLLAARLTLLLRLLILELAEVHDLADRRIGIRGDLNQVEASLFGAAQRLL